jgi:hypothetical protein
MTTPTPLPVPEPLTPEQIKAQRQPLYNLLKQK